MTKVLNMAGNQVGEVELNAAIFGIEPNMHVVHEVVKNHLANCRQGTQSALTRAEVSGGGKKPWRQKGRYIVCPQVLMCRSALPIFPIWHYSKTLHYSHIDRYIQEESLLQYAPDPLLCHHKKHLRLHHARLPIWVLLYLQSYNRCFDTYLLRICRAT